MENEEAEAHSSNPTLYLDPALQERHQSMLERLSNCHQTWTDNSLTRRSADSDSASFPSFEFTSTQLDQISSSIFDLEKLDHCSNDLIGVPKENQKEKEPEKLSFISDLDSCDGRLMGSVMALFVHRFEAKPQDIRVQ